MIAANHPLLGSEMMDDRRAIEFGYRTLPSDPMPVRMPAAPVSQPSPAQPVNQISPDTTSEAISLARVRTATVPSSTGPQTVPVLETPITAPTVAASAAATAPSSTVNTSNGLDSFLNWLTEQTIYSGVPNGAILAGGVIAVSWLFGGKKGRR